ncbi:hypothetical protein B0H14DRAFT_2883492 [Mycena olivaceomarginata]|nr:hypothetical protein B0H14DRAFT_2883492 [Mycena olivaceomarginata]
MTSKIVRPPLQTHSHMRFSTSFLSAIVVAATGAAATGSFSTSSITTAGSLTEKNCYGAPIPPCSPGDTTAPRHRRPPHNPPHTPPKYDEKSYNLECAAQDDSYLTYGLVDTVADCQVMCDSVYGCTFINTYHDVNGKNGSPQLTCALFSKCLTADSADNCGGQSQPDYITDSTGNCKNY